MDPHERRIRTLEAQRLREKQAEENRHLHKAAFVQEATRTPYIWLTEHTKTYNEHWQEEGRPSPYEPLPKWSFLEFNLAMFEKGKIIFTEKSRDLMISWICVGYFTFNAMKFPRRGCIFQTQKNDKVIQLIDYAEHLVKQSDPRIRAAFPLLKRTSLRLEFANGSYIAGIPGGANQIRSYHPWGYLNDESSFQPDVGECYNQALAAVSGKIIFNSSAGPGWFADVRRDRVRTHE